MPGLGYDSQTFVKSDLVDNLETLQVGSAPTTNAKRVILVDSSGNPVVIGGSTIVSGTATVTIAGTAVRLSITSVPIKGIWVNADLLAGVPVTVGDSAVVGNASGMKGIILPPGNPPIFLQVNDLNKIYVDAQSNGGKIAFLYFT